MAEEEATPQLMMSPRSTEALVEEPEVTQADAAVATAAPRSLRAPELYLNRELTWLEFNRRVLQEAQDARNPLLERVKFLAITASNLDEFFMKRIGGLKQQVAAGVQEPTVDGRTPRQQIAECYAEIQDLERQQRVLLDDLLGLLAQHDIAVCGHESLSPAERAELRASYLANVFPLVTPLAIDPAHPFPFVSNLSLNLFVTVRYPGEADASLTRIKVPVGAGIPRFLRLGGRRCYVPLEDVVRRNLDLLLPAMEIDACELFR